ncbi:MAG: alanine racemase [Bacteroidetes bacterium]|nr:MAG: alanine racemase [Bacteroidota bacterium]
MVSKLEKISSPTFVVLKKAVEANIHHFKQKAQFNNLTLRPHFKTHQNNTIAKQFYDLGIRNIAVSNIAMAEEFSHFQWDNISLAFPFNIREIDKLNKISENTQITILVESIETLDFLNQNLINTIGVYIKIDAGYNRTGISYKNTAMVQQLINKIEESDKLILKGLLSHFGNTYSAKSKEEVISIYSISISLIEQLRQGLDQAYNNIPISVGDTPSVSIVDDFGNVDELRPGNFVYYDWMQYKIGSCELNQIAAVMICPIVAKHNDRLQIIIHGGAVHFSKEGYSENNEIRYGQAVNMDNDLSLSLIADTFIKSISQEHGIVQCTEDSFGKFEIGDLMVFIPIHSCLTANLMKLDIEFV